MNNNEISIIGTAKDFRKMASGKLKSYEANDIIEMIFTAKVLSDVKYQILLASNKGKYDCNVSVPEEYQCASDEDGIFKEWINGIAEFLKTNGFEVSVFENILYIDWSKESNTENIDDDVFDKLEKYKNMHKQGKKQHAPRKHNLKVIK